MCQTVVIECELCGIESETENNAERFELRYCLKCFVSEMRRGKLEDLRWKHLLESSYRKKV